MTISVTTAPKYNDAKNDDSKSGDSNDKITCHGLERKKLLAQESEQKQTEKKLFHEEKKTRPNKTTQ